MPDSIDSIFAELSDREICNAWHGAVWRVYHAAGHEDPERLPLVWRVVWNVWGHLGLWQCEGLRCLWGCDGEELDFFIRSLQIIGESLPSERLAKSFDLIDRKKLVQEAYLDGDAVVAIAKQWDKENCMIFTGVEESLAIFARHHRNEAVPLFSELKQEALKIYASRENL